MKWQITICRYAQKFFFLRTLHSRIFDFYCHLFLQWLICAAEKKNQFSAEKFQFSAKKINLVPKRFNLVPKKIQLNAKTFQFSAEIFQFSAQKFSI